MVRTEGDQDPETIEDAPPHSHFEENLHENYQNFESVGQDDGYSLNDPQNWQPDAFQAEPDLNNVNNNAPPPQAFPPQSNVPPQQAFPQQTRSQTQQQPQAFPQPPRSQTQPQPQAFPPSQYNQQQAFPPPQSQLGGQKTDFQAQNVQPQAFPPTSQSQSQYNQQQAFSPQSQGGQKPGYFQAQNVQPQAFPPPSPSQYNQQQGFPPPQSQFGGPKPGFQAQNVQQQTFQPNIQFQNQGFQQQAGPNANTQFQNQGFQQQAAAFQQPQYSVAPQNYKAQPQGGGFPPMQIMQQQCGNNSAATGFPILNQNPSTQGWRTGLFDFMDDPGNAILTAFAPCVTFGQIAEVVDSGQTSCATSGLIYGVVASFTGVPCLISFGYRSKLRARFGLIESPAQDWLVHCLCEWCALCQEYRELQLRGLDPSIGWLGNVAKSQQVQMGPMTPPYNQTMMA